MIAVELYRFTHPDGSAKDWAYRELPTGDAEIRWGPCRCLRQFQFKPIKVALKRAQTKMRQGYVYIGTVGLDAQGRVVSPASAVAASAPFVTRQAVSVRSVPPLALADLFGTESEGFYF